MIYTRVYIDGFNLFHGLIQPNRLHWLDLSEFARRLNRGEPVDRVIYCTSKVSGTESDTTKPDRQDVYLRALAVACPNVEIVYGNFTSHPKAYPVTGCRNDPPCRMRVHVRNEKGTDVNLAARLLHDAHMKRFSRAIVVSGDSDLVEPIKIVTSELKCAVWVKNPRDKDSDELRGVASRYERIRPSVAKESQLPEIVEAAGRVYKKPERWKHPLPAVEKCVVSLAICSQLGCNKIIKTSRHEWRWKINPSKYTTTETTHPT